MSRLDELIKELCPNGVEYKELGEIAKVTIGEFVHKDKQSENAEYPVFNGGISNTGYYNDYNEEKDKIIMSARGANAGYINRVFVNYWAGNSCYTINTNDEIMNWNFLYYVLKNKEKNILNEQQTGSIPSISKKQVEGILVPVPPLEVQEEIVRILDNFTALTAELTAELTARKKQYSWYRDYLLTFENKVEKSKLSEVATIKARIGWQGLTKEEYLITGNYYLITGTDFQNGEINLKNCYYVNEERYIQDKNIQLKNDDVLVTKDGTLGKVAYVSNLDKPATLNSGIFVIRSIDTNKLLNRYLFHYLKAPYLMKYAQNKLTGGTIKHLNQNVIVDFEIPLPPLEVQKRIVEVLDNFEKTCKELNIELSSEIEIKQKEYEFIRNYLLTFEEKSRQAILACELASLRSKQQAQNLIKILQYVYGYVEVRLGDIGSIVRGNGLQKRDFTEDGVGCIHYGQIYTKYGMATEKTISFVKESLAEKLRKVEKGDIIFAVTSENIEDLCKCVVWLGEDEIVTGGHTAILKHNQNSKFLAYYFQTEAFHSQKRKLATGTKVMDVTATKLEEILIPLPPLEEQKRIVDILDRFDRLCNDISEGLPAEIEARQKQYEHYREKLLTFKKL
jgi:type I restriction-modification system specificity subunit